MIPLAAVGDVLAHPLVILLAGTALTGLLVPWIAGNRQRKHKSLDLDVALTETITEGVTSFVMAIQFAAVRPGDREQGERTNEAYHEFMVTVGVVEAKLETYHPGTPLAEEWSRLASQLERFYALGGIPDEGERAAARGRLMDQLGIASADADADSEQWLAIKGALAKRLRDLNRRILDDRGGARI
jgi:hypothetical protein